MRKVLSLLLALAMVLSLAACGGSNNEPANNTPDTPSTSTTEPASAPEPSVSDTATPMAAAAESVTVAVDDDSFKYFILPTLANSLGGLAGFTRQVRASMLEVIRSDYVTTARSKGLRERTVVYGHALPNALIPILTVIGMRFGSMLGGATIVEVIFSIPGIGQYLVNAINKQDYTAATGSIIFIAFTFSVIMLLTDLLYAYADPRIKAQYAGGGRKKVAANG